VDPPGVSAASGLVASMLNFSHPYADPPVSAVERDDAVAAAEAAADAMGGSREGPFEVAETKLAVSFTRG
jgi:hypothetical protein